MEFDIEYIKDEFHDGIDEEEAEFVFIYGKAFPLPPSNDGNDRLMLVCFTYKARLVEVGVEFVTKWSVVIFHAMNATPQYETLFNEE